MCPLCPCSGTTAQYVPVVVLQHSMEEEEHEPSAAPSILNWMEKDKVTVDDEKKNKFVVSIMIINILSIDT